MNTSAKSLSEIPAGFSSSKEPPAKMQEASKEEMAISQALLINDVRLALYQRHYQVASQPAMQMQKVRKAFIKQAKKIV